MDQVSAAGLTFPVGRDEGGIPADLEFRRQRVEMLDAELVIALGERGADCWLDLCDFGCYHLDDTGIRVVREALSAELAHEALGGPLLLHALARRGVYVLHASASIDPEGRVFAFTAASGVGKSTLARRSRELGWTRIADDLLAVSLGPHGVEVRPHLVQPKLAPEMQYPANAAGVLPLAALVRVHRAAMSSLSALEGSETMRLVLASTVASRTFTEQMLVRHLAFAGEFAAHFNAGRLGALSLQMEERCSGVDLAATEALRRVQSWR